MAKKLIILFFILMMFSLNAQYPYQINFTLEPPFYNGGTFNLFYFNYFADFDLDDSASQPLIFTISILNVSTEYHDYELRLDGTWSTYEGQSILTPEINSPQPGGMEIITNQNIVSHDDTSIYAIDNNFDDLENALKDQVLADETGRMPDGVYWGSIQAFEPGTENTLSNQATIYITITSPTPIIQILPGSPLGSSPAEIEDLNPNFVWVSNLFEYTFKIWELEDENITAEEIALLNPLEVIDGIVSTTYTLPPSVQLLNDQVYGWQVSAELLTPENEVVIWESGFYLFIIPSAGATGGGDNTAIIQNILNQMPPGYETTQIQNLLNGGYVPGEIILEGEVITWEQLLLWLENLSNGTWNILGLTVE